MLCILLSLILTGTDISCNVPDSVQAGEIFTYNVTVSGDDLSSAECTPVFSDGLQSLCSSSMHSFSSVTNRSGTSISSQITISMSFIARSPGTHTIGPISLSSSGRKLQDIPLVTITAVGDSLLPASMDPQLENQPDEIAWIEIEIDTTGRVYPGQTFSVDYFICKSRRNAEVVDLYLEPSDYATSCLSGDAAQLQWLKHGNGIYRTRIATLEITPAFACTLSLPVLSGRIGIPGGMLRPSIDHYISSEGERIPVFPFPETDRPDNFSGITDEILFNLDIVTRGYSAAGERCVQLSISGPGYDQLEDSPDLSVRGPAELRCGSRFQLMDNTNAWYILIEPSDSGKIVMGPDSIAWFDTVLEEYKQAVIPACSLSVYPIVTGPADISILNNGNDRSSLIWIITVILLLSVIIITTLRYGNRIVGSAPDISESKDVEELLTAMGYHLSEMFTGSRAYMGAQELDEAMDERTIDIILSRRLLRHWKDLELMLSGRTVSEEQLEKLKKKSIEQLHELKAELKKGNPR